MDNNNQTPTTPTPQTPPQSEGQQPATETTQPVQTPPVTTPATPEQPTSVQATPPQEPAPVTPQPVTTEPPKQDIPATPSQGSHKKPLFLLLGVILVLGILAFAMMSIMGSNNQTQRMGVQQQTPAVTQAPVLEEEQELESIDIENPESELQELDKELDALQ